MTQPSPIRAHLHRLREHEDVDVREMAEALLSLLDMSEINRSSVPPWWIARTIGRHLLK